MQDNPFPRGFIPKVKPGATNDKYLFGYDVEIFPFVQAPFHRSTWFANNPRDDFISPEQKLIITSMEKNERLIGRTPEAEFQRLQELEGIVDIYLPGDRWVIDCEEMDRREILKEIERSVVGQKALKWMVDDAGLSVRLYPVVVGWKPWHYEHCRNLFDVFETQSCAFDATEYDSKLELWQDLDNLVKTLEPDRIYLNGRVSHEQLLHVPDEVVAFSGKKTLLEMIKMPGGGLSRTRLMEIIERRVEALRSTQTELNEFKVIN